MKFLVLIALLSTVWAAEKCCPDVGCFTDDYPFNHVPLPTCAEQIRPSMVVFTRTNQDNGQSITRTTIPPALNENKRVIFIVHGWLGTRNDNWMHEFKYAMLARGDYNVIVTGWEGGSQNLWYPQSASDTRIIGSEIAFIVDRLKSQLGMTPDQFYCTGHSLGSHICGHAGQRTHFGRITGMDPAGPLFEGRDWEVGLHPDCADYVDVIHTNGVAGIILNLGTMKIMGDADYYPSGGRRQPGCILDPRNVASEDQLFDPDFDPRDITPACSHMRVLDLYGESIATDCFHIRHYDCTDQHNLPGSCSSSETPVAVMGFHADVAKPTGIMFIDTNSRRPYCQG